MLESFKNPNLNTVITPPVEGGTERQEAPKQATPQTKEPATGIHRLVETTGGKVLTVGAGFLTLVGITLGGLKLAEATSTPQSHGPVPTEVVPTTPTVPTQEATPESTPTVAPAPETQTPPDISKYESMPIAEFSALSSDEQMIFAAGKLIPSINQYAADYEGMTHKTSDVLSKSSLDDTALKIDTAVAYNLRFAFMLTGDDREKFIIAVLRNNNQSGFYPIMEGFSKLIPNAADGSDMGYFDKIASGSVTEMGDMNEDTNHDKFRALSTNSANGLITYNAYYVQVPLPDGTTYNTWIRE